MIQIPNRQLSDATQTELDAYQLEIDALGDYAEQVNRAADLFKQRNTKNNPVFREVRQNLNEMCAGVSRCMYCEDSCADEIEHIRPKSWYPELTFVWENYLYACGPCNGGKKDKYALIIDGELTRLKRDRQGAIKPPPDGEPAFIDPRHENPLSHLILDLSSFAFVPQSLPTSISAREQERARYTIDVLGLNRDVLLRARRSAYRGYENWLKAYIQDRDKGADTTTSLADLHAMNHPTVWEEMKRQHTRIPELKALFDQAPEALNW